MKKYKKIAFVGIITILALSGCYREIVYNGEFTVHFLDVGQGDASLIELPGDEVMLIDAGDNGTEGEIIDYIDSLGIDKIDYLVATHPHADHIGGMEEIIEAYDIGSMYMTRAEATSKTFEKMLDAIEEKNIAVYSAEAGKSIINGEGLSAEILSPEKELSGDKNNDSAVVKITYGEKVFLFMGDAEKDAEYGILKKYSDIDCDVLKVGHHGSSTSSGRRFLDKAKPEYAVISCGKGNTYGHPHKESLKMLKGVGAEIFRTDELGTIIISTDGEKIDVEK